MSPINPDWQNSDSQQIFASYKKIMFRTVYMYTYVHVGVVKHVNVDMLTLLQKLQDVHP